MEYALILRCPPHTFSSNAGHAFLFSILVLISCSVLILRASIFSEDVLGHQRENTPGYYRASYPFGMFGKKIHASGNVDYLHGVVGQWTWWPDILFFQ